MPDSVLQLRCGCNNMPWGKKGSNSLSARLMAKTPGTDEIDEEQPYSEMWMGTYPELPSYIASSGEDLQQYLNKHKEELIGESVLKKFGSDLPYLPKVLSIAKALPLQVHPNTELARLLHEKDPENFTDPNHKPEIALALTEFEGFCGWKPLDQINKLVQSLPPVQQFMPKNQEYFSNNTLKELVRNILSAPDEVIEDAQNKLMELPKDAFGNHTYIQELLPRLQEQYEKSDPGNLVALLTMNFIVLHPGESIFIPADGIHAYLSGDIIECMARSNNVLNSGFCPKTQRNSVDRFVETLTFNPHSELEAYLPSRPAPQSKNGKTQLYAPPMPEFNMLATHLGKGEKEGIEAVGGPSVLIAVNGDGTLRADGKDYELKEGWVYFIGQGVEAEYESSSGMDIYRAYVE